MSAAPELEPLENDGALLQKLGEYLPVSTTRVETALSRFPIHNLTKTENISIRINRRNQAGETDISWSVSPSRDYGEPRQLAYKLDTLLINRRIDEATRPTPRLLRLGTLREICRELGVQMNGPQANSIKRALYQNAFAGITAKISYTSTEGRVRRFEKGFTRYSVYFAGEELPNDEGRLADAVYIYLNEDYWQLLNNAVFRPLDYDYQKTLSAGAQRFYELVSYLMFGALSKRRGEVKLVYSDYCLRAPQTRYFTRAEVQKQMYKLHRPHVEAGYIEKTVRYRQTTDQDGKADWEMFYTPGPRAKAQYVYFTKRQRTQVTEIAQAADVLGPPLELEESITVGMEELLRRGIDRIQAKALNESRPESNLLDLLEWGDHLIRSSSSRIRNPAGFYIHLIRNGAVPLGFETTRLKALREDAQRTADLERGRELRIQLSYEEYQQERIDFYIANDLPEEVYQRTLNAKRGEVQKAFRNLPDSTIDEITRQGVRNDLRESGVVPMMSMDEFARKHHPDQMVLL